MKKRIAKIIKKYADCQMNLSSIVARDILTEEINKEVEKELQKLKDEIKFQNRLLDNVHKITNKYPEIKKVISGELIK